MKLYILKQKIIKTLEQSFNEKWTMYELNNKLKELNLTNFNIFFKDIRDKINDMLSYYGEIKRVGTQYYSSGYDLQVKHNRVLYQEEYTTFGNSELLADNKQELIENFAVNLIVGKINRENN